MLLRTVRERLRIIRGHASSLNERSAFLDDPEKGLVIATDCSKDFYHARCEEGVRLYLWKDGKPRPVSVNEYTLEKGISEIIFHKGRILCPQEVFDPERPPGQMSVPALVDVRKLTGFETSKPLESLCVDGKTVLGVHVRKKYPEKEENYASTIFRWSEDLEELASRDAWVVGLLPTPKGLFIAEKSLTEEGLLTFFTYLGEEPKYQRRPPYYLSLRDDPLQMAYVDKVLLPGELGSILDENGKRVVQFSSVDDLRAALRHPMEDFRITPALVTTAESKARLLGFSPLRGPWKSSLMDQRKRRIHAVYRFLYDQFEIRRLLPFDGKLVFSSIKSLYATYAPRPFDDCTLLDPLCVSLGTFRDPITGIAVVRDGILLQELRKEAETSEPGAYWKPPQRRA